MLPREGIHPEEPWRAGEGRLLPTSRSSARPRFPSEILDCEGGGTWERAAQRSRDSPPCPWERSRPGRTGLGATRSRGRCPCPRGRAWMVFKVAASPNDSVIFVVGSSWRQGGGLFAASQRYARSVGLEAAGLGARSRWGLCPSAPKTLPTPSVFIES